MKITSKEHNPEIIKLWKNQDKSEIDDLIKYRDWVNDRLEVHSHHREMRDIMTDHLYDINNLISIKKLNYKENYGEAY